MRITLLHNGYLKLRYFTYILLIIYTFTEEMVWMQDFYFISSEEAIFLE